MMKVAHVASPVKDRRNEQFHRLLESVIDEGPYDLGYLCTFQD